MIFVNYLFFFQMLVGGLKVKSSSVRVIIPNFKVWSNGNRQGALKYEYLYLFSCTVIYAFMFFGILSKKAIFILKQLV